MLAFEVLKILSVVRWTEAVQKRTLPSARRETCPKPRISRARVASFVRTIEARAHSHCILAHFVADGAMHEAVPAIASMGVSPIVRIADNQGWMVKRALDCGAHGILVPLLYTVEDAEKLVRSAKFPPVGQRGFGSPYAPQRFGASLGSSEYLQQANDALLTMVQIETKEALENVDAIAAVPGIDLLFVGPFDLGNNIGHPIIDGMMHDNLHAAIAKVLKAANKAGKKAGIFCTSGEQAKGYADEGFHMISVATDMFVLPAGVTAALKTVKGSEGDPKATGPYGR